MSLAAPLGGTLVNRCATDEQAQEWRARAAHLPRVILDRRHTADLDLLGNGAYSPLLGFMSGADYRSVVSHAHLADGTPWTLPIVLPVAPDEARSLHGGSPVALIDTDGGLRGILELSEVFERHPEVEAREVYRTTDATHPGVRQLLRESRLLAGGTVCVLPAPTEHRVLGPAATRAEFERRGWSSVVAFQTRNPIHRAHEYLTKVALELVDGLFLHPLSGATKDDDISFEVRMRCYNVLLARYYPQGRVVFGLFPAAMRYAGPREAIYHGLVRRNYGCSHFIIGRDAAGVSSYYGPYDAQALYDELGGPASLGFTALKFEHAFFCRRCDGMVSARTCPHDATHHVALSGTRVRALLAEGDAIPPEFTRPEVATILRDAYAAERSLAAV